MTNYLPQDSGELSLWGKTAVAPVDTGALAETLEVDVLVVGAGFTGLSTALHLAEQDISVAVLESRSVGFGGSGRNAGLVNAGVWQTPDYVVEQLGEEAGNRFNQALYHSPEVVFELIDRYQISCQASRQGTINIAHSASAVKYLQNRCRQLQKLGAETQFIDGDKSAAMSGSSHYRHGGILDPNAGTIQPLSYVRGLARAAIGQGAQLFQNTPLVSLDRVDNHWLARTPDGEVSAEKVVLATNAYADENSQGVRDTTQPMFLFHCATEPLAEDVAASIIPERQGLWDTQLLLTSSRIDEDGRLVMCSAGSLHGVASSIRKKWIKRLRDRLYPQAKAVPWAYHWCGQIGITSNKLLKIQLLAPGLYAPAGYNGRGIGPGTVIGKHLANTLISGNRNEFPFPVEALHREKWRKIRGMYYEYGTLALQFL